MGPCKQEQWPGPGQGAGSSVRPRTAITDGKHVQHCRAFVFPSMKKGVCTLLKRYNYDRMLKKSGFTLFNSGTVCIDSMVIFH